MKKKIIRTSISHLSPHASVVTSVRHMNTFANIYISIFQLTQEHTKFWLQTLEITTFPLLFNFHSRHCPHISRTSFFLKVNYCNFKFLSSLFHFRLPLSLSCSFSAHSHCYRSFVFLFCFFICAGIRTFGANTHIYTDVRSNKINVATLAHYLLNPPQEGVERNFSICAIFATSEQKYFRFYELILMFRCGIICSAVNTRSSRVLSHGYRWRHISKSTHAPYTFE